MPYHRPKRSEVVVQKFDGLSWSTMPTVLRRGTKHRSSSRSCRPPRVKYPSARLFNKAVAVFPLTGKVFNVSV